MLDIRVIRNEPERVVEGLSRRHSDVNLAELQDLDRQFRENQTALDALRSERNTASEQIAKLKKSGQDATGILTDMKKLSERVKELEADQSSIEAQRGAFMLRIPNLLDASVPNGQTEDDNVEVRRWGATDTLTFEAKSHNDLGEALGILDFERAAKLAGARFVVMKGAAARLERAVMNMMLDLHTGEHGYTEIQPPYVSNEETLTANGNQLDVNNFRPAFDSNGRLDGRSSQFAFDIRGVDQASGPGAVPEPAT
ncbi:MAG: hypothetical protein ACK46X_21775, partial [Candidatus Sericytochromatia bacterium]